MDIRVNGVFPSFSEMLDDEDGDLTAYENILLADENGIPILPDDFDIATAIANLDISSSKTLDLRDEDKKSKDLTTQDGHQQRTDATAVILSPLSFSHVFSRSWVPKAHLKTIVERPQRLQASCIGIGSAVALTSPSTFLVESSTKRSQLSCSPHVLKVHGLKWAKQLEKLCTESEIKLSESQLEVPDGWHSGDIYLCKGTLTALEGSIGAVETGIDKIFSSSSRGVKRCFVSLRPPGHHCHTNAPSGFCLINNVHIAAQYAADKYKVSHVVILDFDLHHGDGTQDIAWKLGGFQGDDDEEEEEEESNKSGPKIGYFSLHDINSFPAEPGYTTPEIIKNASTCVMAHGLCIWNIHLSPYKNIQEFEKLYKEKYSILFEKAREFLSIGRDEDREKFNGLVLISAGFDASEFEDKSMQRHGVNLPTKFYSNFTNDAVKLGQEYCNGHVMSILEGGYSNCALYTGITSHLMGMQGYEFDSSWINQDNLNMFEKGCKMRWSANPKSGTQAALLAEKCSPWVAKAVALGRSYWPASLTGKPTAAAASPLTPTANQVNKSIKTPRRVTRSAIKETTTTTRRTAGIKSSPEGRDYEEDSPLTGKANQQGSSSSAESSPAGYRQIVDSMHKMNIVQQDKN